MSASLNRVELIGRLGRDPEVKYTSSGQAVAKFSVATDEQYTDRAGDLNKHTEWHQIVAWGKLAEICQQYVRKGRQVWIEGRIRMEEWEDRQATPTITRRRYTIVASRLLMLGARPDGALPANGEVASGEEAEDPRNRGPVTDDDVAF